MFFGVLDFGFRVFWGSNQLRCKLESVINILIVTDMSSHNMIVSFINRADVVLLPSSKRTCLVTSRHECEHITSSASPT